MSEELHPLRDRIPLRITVTAEGAAELVAHSRAYWRDTDGDGYWLVSEVKHSRSGEGWDAIFEWSAEPVGDDSRDLPERVVE